MKIRPVEAKF